MTKERIEFANNLLNLEMNQELHTDCLTCQHY